MRVGDCISSFGDTIKKIRNDKKLSLKEVAKRGNFSHSYLSQVENGVRNAPKPDMIKKISKGLNAEYEDLLFSAGYISKPEAEKISKFIEKTPNKYDLNNIIDSAYINTDFIYEGETLNQDEKIFIADVLRIILRNDIPVEYNEKKKVLNLIETILK